ncbi:GIY-YIG nuclease family protein [Bacillus wiedmannii]|uniref:GIY-YIG nuclease family protein n=1 Tax=Bacillus wiedmannii TaxID=1890302 RepID=UPI0021D13B78|nr:GIY-YIG nuclease family protein [Bacillus wiedmannii]MCU5706140.1 GIY-YIG nuclease family protein [Bacillus wiedmannii]
MTKVTGIYKITNKINGKCYIGQSLDIPKRWENHKCMNGNHSYPLYLAFKKYGLDNFSFEIIERCSKEEMEHLEYYYILLYDSTNHGYNQTLQTKNPLLDKEIMERAIENMTIQHRTKEHREKQSKISTKLWEDEEYRAKVTRAINSIESKNKMSKASKLNWKENRSELLKTLRKSWREPELRKKRSDNQKKKFRDEEYRELNKDNLKKANAIYVERMRNDKDFRDDCIKKMREASKSKMKSIDMLDKITLSPIMTFESLAEAARWIQDNTKFIKADYATIRKAGKSETRSAYGYKWKVHESVETSRKA